MLTLHPAPATTPRLTLVYAKMQVLAEPARMLLSYANVPHSQLDPYVTIPEPYARGIQVSPKTDKVVPFEQQLI